MTVRIYSMQEAEWKNRKAKRSANIEAVEPIYKMEDADGAIRQIVPCHYDTMITICPGIQIRFTDIGHLLGSSSIEVWITENGISKKIVFSGDIGNTDQADYQGSETCTKACRLCRYGIDLR